ncbi:MAG: CatB-related O-acetyltransferase [Gammaproteobacteria bacterium]|nr:CatB-related O-acetyltransferase [Gammaproteobacteria bacterium]
MDTQETIHGRYPQYQIGRGTYGIPRVRARDDGATLKIGSYTSIATDVEILLGGEHRIDWVTTYPFNVLSEEGKGINGHPKTKGDVVIGSDVWIGTGSTILSGVTIGDGAVIGAKSVVVKDVPSYSIFAGNPASLIKTRFSHEIIRQLMDIKWWNWSDDEIRAAIPFLLSDDIQRFIDFSNEKKQTNFSDMIGDKYEY